jgi:hypothetical protein
MHIIRNLLWIDCSAGALVGVLLLLFSGWLSSLYSLPLGVLHVMGVMNLLYAAYSLSLAMRGERPKILLGFLIAANAIWALICLALAAYFFATATFWGIGQLLGEAVFVGGLAALEWRFCQQLLARVERFEAAP